MGPQIPPTQPSMQSCGVWEVPICSGEEFDTDGKRYNWCKDNEYLDDGKITGMKDPPPALGTCKWEWGNRNAYRHDKRKSNWHVLSIY